MKLFLLITVLGFGLQWVLPWWILALVCFALAFWLARRVGEAFWAGFAGIALGWLALGLFFHLSNNGILTGRIATLFSLPSPWLLLVITPLVGGLVGGLAALTGYFFRRVI